MEVIIDKESEIEVLLDSMTQVAEEKEHVFPTDRVLKGPDGRFHACLLPNVMAFSCQLAFGNNPNDMIIPLFEVERASEVKPVNRKASKKMAKSLRRLNAVAA